MTHPAPADVHALVGAYAIDALDGDERADFEAHLAACGECQAEIASLQEAASSLPATTELRVPAQLRARLLASLGEQDPAPERTAAPAAGAPAAGTTVASTPAATAPVVQPVATHEVPLPAATAFGDDVVVLPKRKVRLAALAVAASIVAAAAVGSTIVDELQHDDPPPAAAPSLADRILAAEDAEEVAITFDDGAKATVVRSSALGRALIVTENMPAPPPDSVYQLWFEDKEEGMVSAGVMPTVSDQTFLLQGRAQDANAVGITVEPAGGSVLPSTQQTVALFEFDPAGA